MEEWRENWDRLRETTGRLREKEAVFVSRRAKVQKARNTLAASLMDSPDKPFSVLFEAARNRVQKGEELTGQRTAIEWRLDNLRRNLASLERKSSGLLLAVETAKANWILSCRSAGLSEDTTPESGLRLLQERKELLATFDRWTTLSSEVEAKAGDIDRKSVV